MATIVREDIDALNVLLTVTVAKEDYLEDFKKELKRYRNQAQLKGFRKGKVPMTVVRKMFGRSILAEVVNKDLGEAMSKFLYDEENSVDFLGQPIGSEEQEEFDFNITNLDDYVFKFDLGLAPQFELQGLGGEETLERLVIEPEGGKVGEELMNLRRKFGATTDLEEGTVEERDIISLKAVEMDGDSPKEDGIEHEFTLFINNTTDSAKEAFMGKPVGHVAVLNVFELEEDTSEEMVRKYLLGLEPEDEREVSDAFSLTIQKITRNTPAELEEEFFEQAFAEGDVSNEEEAIAKIKDDYNKYYIRQTDALLFREMQESLMEKNQLELPENFLKRWLVESNEKNTPANVEAGFDGFRKGLQWTLIREKLISKFELKVTPEEMRESFAQQVIGYFGGQRPDFLGDEMISGMVERMMKDEKGVREKHDELINDKLSERLQEEYVLTDKVIDPAQLDAIIKEIQAKNEAENILLDEEE